MLYNLSVIQSNVHWMEYETPNALLALNGDYYINNKMRQQSLRQVSL